MRRSGVPLPLTALLPLCLALALLLLHHAVRPAPAAPHGQTAFAPLRVRAGASTSLTDARGAVWQPDTGASGGTAAWWYTAPIEGTGDDPLYRTERYGAFGYRFGVPNGTYAVTLKFAETHWKAGDRGRRVFDVQLEGATVLSRFDILAEVGPNTALDKTFAVSVLDGALDLRFVSIADNAKVSAIEVVAGGGGGPAPAPPASTATASPRPPAATATVAAPAPPAATATASPRPPAATAVPTASGGTVVDVCAYGACNGGDQAAATQRAIDSLPPSGGTLIVPRMIDIGPAGVRLGQRQQTTVRGTNGGGFRALAPTKLAVRGHGPFVFVVSDCDRCTIEDLTIDGNGVAGVLALGLQDLDDATVQRLRIQRIGRQNADNSGQTGSGALSTAGNRGVRYLNNTIEDTGGDQSAPRPGNATNGRFAIRGMWLGNDDADQREYGAVVEGNVFRRCGGTCLAWHGAGDLRVSNNQFLNSFAGIKSNDIEPQRSGTVLIEGNLIDSVSGGHGMQLSGGQAQDFGSIMAHTHVVRNNTIRNAAPGSAAILLDPTPPDNVTITGNLLENNGSGGIFVHGIQNLTIRGNTIRRAGGAQRQGIGLQDGYTFSNVSIACNTISGHDDFGLRFGTNTTYINGLTVTDNTFTGNTPYAVYNASGGRANPTMARNNYSGNAATAYGVAAGAGTPSC